MVEAFVLVQSDAGQAGRVTEDLRKIPGVASVKTVTGPFDIIVRIEAEDVDLLGKLVVSALHDVDGVVRTLTCPIAKF